MRVRPGPGPIARTLRDVQADLVAGPKINKKTVHPHWRQLGLKLARPQVKLGARRPQERDPNNGLLRPSSGKDDVEAGPIFLDQNSNGRALE